MAVLLANKNVCLLIKLNYLKDFFKFIKKYFFVGLYFAKKNSTNKMTLTPQTSINHVY